MVKTSVNAAFFAGDRPAESAVSLSMACVDAAITDHFEMFFRDVPDEAADEFHGRDGFLHVPAVLVAIVMEGNKVPIVAVDAGSGDDRASKIAADIFDHCLWVAFVRLGIDIKTIFVLLVAAGFYFFERWADQRFHFVQ